jgi:hypothetical protein
MKCIENIYEVFFFESFNFLCFIFFLGVRNCNKSWLVIITPEKGNGGKYYYVYFGRV